MEILKDRIYFGEQIKQDLRSLTNSEQIEFEFEGRKFNINLQVEKLKRWITVMK